MTLKSIPVLCILSCAYTVNAAGIVEDNSWLPWNRVSNNATLSGPDAGQPSPTLAGPDAGQPSPTLAGPDAGQPSPTLAGPDAGQPSPTLAGPDAGKPSPTLAGKSSPKPQSSWSMWAWESVSGWWSTPTPAVPQGSRLQRLFNKFNNHRAGQIAGSIIGLGAGLYGLFKVGEYLINKTQMNKKSQGSHEGNQGGSVVVLITVVTISLLLLLLLFLP